MTEDLMTTTLNALRTDFSELRKDVGDLNKTVTALNIDTARVITENKVKLALLSEKFERHIADSAMEKVEEKHDSYNAKQIMLGILGIALTVFITYFGTH